MQVDYHKNFLKVISKIKDESLKIKIKKQILKIIDNPEKGKPMMYVRKGTREIYVAPYRIAYSYIQSQKRIIFLDIYHKDNQ